MSTEVTLSLIALASAVVTYLGLRLRSRTDVKVQENAERPTNGYDRLIKRMDGEIADLRDERAVERTERASEREDYEDCKKKLTAVEYRLETAEQRIALLLDRFGGRQ